MIMTRLDCFQYCRYFQQWKSHSEHFRCCICNFTTDNVFFHRANINFSVKDHWLQWKFAPWLRQFPSQMMVHCEEQACHFFHSSSLWIMNLTLTESSHFLALWFVILSHCSGWILTLLYKVASVHWFVYSSPIIHNGISIRLRSRFWLGHYNTLIPFFVDFFRLNNVLGMVALWPSFSCQTDGLKEQWFCSVIAKQTQITPPPWYLTADCS